MSTQEGTTARHGQRVRANGIDIHYLEQGEGEPLLLLHGGMVSTNPIWTGVPVAYASHMATFANHFRVIAPSLKPAIRGRSSPSAAIIATTSSASRSKLTGPPEWTVRPQPRVSGAITRKCSASMSMWPA